MQQFRRLFSTALSTIPFFLIFGPAAAERQPSFSEDVLPILEARCADCHGGWFPDAGLRVGSVKDLRKGGRSGPAVVPGKSDKGWLMFALEQTQGRYKMPPEGERLTAQEVDTLRAWIEAGAKP